MISLRRIKPSTSIIFSYLSSSSSSSSSSRISNGSWDPSASLSLNHPTLILLEKPTTTIHHFKQILSQMMRFHLITQTFPMSRLLYFSAISHPHCLDNAILLFNHFTPCPNLFIFNTMISALSFSPPQSLRLYETMLSYSVSPDQHTLLSLLKSSHSLSLGANVHAHVIVFGLHSQTYLQNSLIKMYAENGQMGLAHLVFEQMRVRDNVSYNILISGYGKKGCFSKAFELFGEMLVLGVEPDQHTMVGLLMCCGHMKNVLVGKSVHGLMVRKASLGIWGLVLTNAIMDMYVKFEDMKSALEVFDRLDERDGISWNIIISGFAQIGELDSACKFFDEAPVRDLVSWNSLLAGSVQKGEFKRVTELFKAMVAQNIRPDKITAINLVCAASEIGILNQGRCIHGWAFKLYNNVDAFLGSALIDMYSKCGSIERSLAVFKTLPNKDITVWTAMITGLAFHGHGIEALEIYREMKEHGTAPNSVTFIAVLIACSHAGLVEQGYEIFKDMKESYGIEPGLEHYGCLVDLFARSGRVKDAVDVIRRMPMKPTQSIWGAVLSASKVHKDLRIAEDALRELMVLEPEKEGGYVLLSNAYASFGQWRCSDEVREIMGRRGIKKIAGCSSLVVGGVANEFLSADKRHPRIGDIYSMLDGLHGEMKSGAELI